MKIKHVKALVGLLLVGQLAMLMPSMKVSAEEQDGVVLDEDADTDEDADDDEEDIDEDTDDEDIDDEDIDEDTDDKDTDAENTDIELEEIIVDEIVTYSADNNIAPVALDHTVTFSVESKYNVTIPSQTVTDGDSVTDPGVTELTQSGSKENFTKHTVLFWYTKDAAGEENVFDFTADTVTSDITLYPFAVNVGNVTINSETIDLDYYQDKAEKVDGKYYLPITLPSMPDKENYEFTGWLCMTSDTYDQTYILFEDGTFKSLEELGVNAYQITSESLYRKQHISGGIELTPIYKPTTTSTPNPTPTPEKTPTPDSTPESDPTPESYEETAIEETYEAEEIQVIETQSIAAPAEVALIAEVPVEEPKTGDIDGFNMPLFLSFATFDSALIAAYFFLRKRTSL